MMRSSSGATVRGILTLALLLCGNWQPAFCQKNTAVVFGMVTDTSGAVVPGTVIKIENVGTGERHTAVSDASGNFVLPDLTPGEYSLTATQKGFKEYIQKNLSLDVDQRPQISITLEVGDVAESVTVAEAIPVVEATHANVGGVVENVNIEQLPLNGRQFLQLALLLPGVSPAAGGQTTAAGGGPRNVGLQLGGNRATNNTYLIDGVDSFGFRFKNTSLRPSVASIQEFKILESPYDPQYGVVSGLTVNIITKSGTNSIHGELFEFFRNDTLDARNFFDLQKPPYRQNQFGGSIGGPIRKNKTFLFVTYEGFRARRGLAVGAQVPTLAERSGDFSSEPEPVIDPLSATPFSGNVIPPSRISATSQKFLALFPTPNTGAAAPNFINAASQSTNEYQDVARFDHSFSDTWKIFARYTISDVNQLTPGGIPKFGHIGLMTVQNAAFGSTYIFGPQTFLDVRIGYNRENATDGIQQVGKVADYGIAGLHVSPETDGTPEVDIQGFTSIGDYAYNPQGRVENSEQFTGNLMRIQGRHTIRVGGTIWPTQLNRVYVSGNQRGVFTFTDLYTHATTGLPDFLLGLPFQATRDLGIAREDARATLFNFYGADDIRVSRRLTVSLGLRYELHQSFIDKENHLSAFIPQGEGRIVVAGDPNNGFTGRQNRALYPTPKKNFAPRIGIAYDLSGDGKTILRSGYGIFYNLAIFNSQFLAAINAPFVTTETFQANPAAGVILNFDNPFAAAPGAGGLPGGLMLTTWFKQGYMQQWSFGIQRQLAANLGLEVTYLANKGTSLDGLRVLNQGALPGASNAAYVRAFPNFGTFVAADSFGDSIYHSLQARLTRRFSGGLTFISSYTYGHSIDNSSGEGGGSGGQFIAMDDRNIRLERGNSDFDVRQRLTLSTVYDIPFGPGKRMLRNANGITGKLLEGWQIAAIYQAQSGLPFNVVQSGNRSGTFGGAERADRICDGNLSGGARTRTRWFDTSCFTESPLGQFGNSGRGILRYAPINNFDFSVIKQTRISESRQLEFRAEFFNLANHTQFGSTQGVVAGTSAIDNNVSDTSTFGVYTAARDPRIIQFGLKLVY